MPTLYHFNGATCAVKVLLTLSEKQVAFEERLLQRAELATAEYRALNRNGVVPTLVHDGEVVVESSIIMMYIDDAFAGPSLTPSAPAARARMNLWLRLVDDAFAPLTVLTYAMVARNSLLAMPLDEREAYYRSIPDLVKREQRRSVVERGMEAPELSGAVHALIQLQKRAEETLSATRYLVGDYSLADAALTPFIFRMDCLGLLELARQPALARWWYGVRERPSFHDAISSRVPPATEAEIRAVAERQRPRLRQLIDELW